MAVNLYPNGMLYPNTFPASLGAKRPLMTTQKVIYLSSVTGNDSYTGIDSSKPKATLAAALAAMSANDYLHIFSHDETITVPVTSDLDGITILGNNASLTRNGDIVMLTLSGAYASVDGVTFPAYEAGEQSVNPTLLMGAGTGVARVSNCEFYSNENDAGPKLLCVTGTDLDVNGCKFVSEATSLATLPYAALMKTDGLAVLNNVIFDGGTFGWADYAANLTCPTVRATDIDLLRGSDILLAETTVGHVHVRNKSGSARVFWNYTPGPA